MKRNLRNNKKGMSIVISTIIIVAISITMAIAVSFWAMGIGNSFTRFEKLEFITVYAADTAVTNQPGEPLNLSCYQIWITLKNTGTNTATINNIFLDGKPFNAGSNRTPRGILAYQYSLQGVMLQTGETRTGNIYLPVGGIWNSGDYVALEIQTSAGRDYPYTVVLP